MQPCDSQLRFTPPHPLSRAPYCHCKLNSYDFLIKMVLVSSAILTQMTDMDAVFPLLSRSPFTYNYVVKPQDNPLSKLLTGFEKPKL